MAQGFEEVQSWSGLGVGTDRESFLDHLRERIGELEPEEAAEAVFCTLARRLSGGTAQRLVEQLPEDVRDLFSRCPRRAQDNAPKGSKDDFYLEVAEHLMVDPDDVRRIISGVFYALHTQITERESRSIERELPSDISYTWVAARHGAPAPH